MLSPEGDYHSCLPDIYGSPATVLICIMPNYRKCDRLHHSDLFALWNQQWFCVLGCTLATDVQQTILTSHVSTDLSLSSFKVAVSHVNLSIELCLTITATERLTGTNTIIQQMWVRKIRGSWVWLRFLTGSSFADPRSKRVLSEPLLHSLSSPQSQAGISKPKGTTSVNTKPASCSS